MKNSFTIKSVSSAYHSTGVNSSVSVPDKHFVESKNILLWIFITVFSGV